MPFQELEKWTPSVRCLATPVGAARTADPAENRGEGIRRGGPYHRRDGTSSRIGLRPVVRTLLKIPCGAAARFDHLGWGGNSLGKGTSPITSACSKIGTIAPRLSGRSARPRGRPGATFSAADEALHYHVVDGARGVAARTAGRGSGRQAQGDESFNVSGARISERKLLGKLFPRQRNLTYLATSPITGPSGSVEPPRRRPGARSSAAGEALHHHVVEGARGVEARTAGRGSGRQAQGDESCNVSGARISERKLLGKLVLRQRNLTYLATSPFTSPFTHEGCPPDSRGSGPRGVCEGAVSPRAWGMACRASA